MKLKIYLKPIEIEEIEIEYMGEDYNAILSYCLENNLVEIDIITSEKEVS